MTIRKRLSKTNTRILLSSLLALLIVGSLVIEIFETTYLDELISYVKLQDGSVEIANLLNGYPFEEEKMEDLREEIRSYGYQVYVAKDGEILYSDFPRRHIREMEHLENYATDQEEADVFVWESATMIFKDYEGEDGTYRIVALRDNGDTGQILSNREAVRWLIPVFMLIGILAIGLIVGISQYFRKKLEDQLMEPIEKLIDAANRIEDGNFEEKVEYEGDEEFEKLCHTFNSMQESLKAGIERADAYEQARTEMISGISHDLKTPLTSIKGYIKGVKDGVANTPRKQEQYLDIAYQKACAMEGLLQKLSYFAKLETGDMPMYPVDTDLGEFIREMIEENEEDLREKNADILYSVPEQQIPVSIDHDQMHRVIYNIIENSLKYRCRERVLIRIHLLLKGKNVIFKIADDGEGVPEEKLPHLFEQFYRGDETRNSRIDGDGLGLYISKRIIEQHGGRIYASNHGGFCVTMVLPLNDTEG